MLMVIQQLWLNYKGRACPREKLGEVQVLGSTDRSEIFDFVREFKSKHIETVQCNNITMRNFYQLKSILF